LARCRRVGRDRARRIAARLEVLRQQVRNVAGQRVTLQSLGHEPMPALAARGAPALGADLLDQRVGEPVASVGLRVQKEPSACQRVARVVDLFDRKLESGRNQVRRKLGTHHAGGLQHALFGRRQAIQLHVDQLLYAGGPMRAQLVDRDR
jgi:hypothetical protein